MYQGNNPESSNITEAKGEVTDLKVKLRDSMSTNNELNCRIHEIVDTMMLEPDSEMYSADAEYLKAFRD